MSNAAKKKGTLSRDQAAAMYEDLRKNFAAYSGKSGPEIAKAAAERLGKIPPKGPSMQRSAPSSVRDLGSSPEEQLLAVMLAKQAAQKQAGTGSKVAVSLLLLAAGFKLALGGIEYSGILGVENAQASISTGTSMAFSANHSPEQVALLKALDSRRSELEERRRSLDKRAEEMATRDREFAVKLAELRELTQTLKGNRDNESKKKTTQLDQLSNVYGSMDPKEAALLIEQLDDTIAIELLNRMPEKRIGQILALMTKEKALLMTRMLSGKGANA